MFKRLEKYKLERENQYALNNLTYKITYGQLYDYIAYSQIELKKEHKAGENIILIVESQMVFAIQFLCFASIGCWVMPVPHDIADEELVSLQNEVNGIVYKCDVTVLEQCLNGVFKEYKIDHSHVLEGGILHLTSGTTGKTKICVRKLDALCTEGENYIQCFNLNQQDKILSVCPIQHSFAFGGAFMPAIMIGASIFVVENMIPRQVLRTIESEKITILLMVPTIANYINLTNRNNKYDMSSLRVALVGAGKITKELYEDYLNRYQISLCSNYGSTETGGLVSRVDSRNYETIGKAMPGVVIKICDEDGNVVESGQAGCIYIKSLAMFTGYYGDSNIVFDEEGYFDMGDMGKQDQEGYVYMLGRKKQLVKMGGKTVNPTQIEEVILKNEHVTECVVVGKIDEKQNEYLKAYIVSEKLSQKEIRSYLSQHLSHEKIPKVIEFVSKLERNAVGKIVYSQL